MDEHTLTDRIRNNHITKGLGVANTEKKMKENRLRWIRHMQQQNIAEAVKKIEIWKLEIWNQGDEDPR